MDLINHIEQSIDWARKDVSKLTFDVLNIQGLSSDKVRFFLNNLCSIDDITYLEVGVFRGSTFCSAMYGNKIRAIGIDNWSSPFLTPKDDKHKRNFLYRDKTSDPKEEFLDNVKKLRKRNIIEAYMSNYLTFDYSKIKPVDIVFYDGETKPYDQYDTIKKIIPIMSNSCILVVDDWNWPHESVLKAIEESGVNIRYQKNIYTKGEDLEDFWNGLGIFLLEK